MKERHGQITVAAQLQHDKQIYNMSYSYLLEQYIQLYQGTEENLVNYLADPVRPSSLPEIYERLLQSAQNYWRTPRHISGAIGGIKALSPLLGGFEPTYVLHTYHESPDEVLASIFENLLPGRPIPSNPRSLWRRYSRSIISGARFLASFQTIEDFTSWADSLYENETTMIQLPEITGAKVDHMGFVLACDMLKELGYVQYPKPDSWMRKMCVELRLSDSGDVFPVYHALRRVARNTGKTPYHIDKVLWLIGSGNFYHEPQKRKGWPSYKPLLALVGHASDQGHSNLVAF